MRISFLSDLGSRDARPGFERVWREGSLMFSRFVYRNSPFASSPAQSRETTIEASLLPFFIAFAAYPAIAFIRGPLRRWRRRKKGLCIGCGYNLTGNVSGVCPECGTKAVES